MRFSHKPSSVGARGRRIRARPGRSGGNPRAPRMLRLVYSFGARRTARARGRRPIPGTVSPWGRFFPGSVSFRSAPAPDLRAFAAAAIPRRVGMLDLQDCGAAIAYPRRAPRPRAKVRRAASRVWAAFAPVPRTKSVAACCRRAKAGSSGRRIIEIWRAAAVRASPQAESAPPWSWRVS